MHKFHSDDIVDHNKIQGETYRQWKCEASRCRKGTIEVASIVTDRYKVIGIKKAISGMNRLCPRQKQKHKKRCLNNTCSD